MALLVLFKILAIVHVTYGLPSTSIELVSYEHKFSSQVFSVLTYQLIKVADRKVVNGSAILNRDMEGMNIRIIAYSLQGRKRKNFKWFDISEDVCKIIDKNRKMPMNLIYYLREALDTSGHLVADKCPYKKGEDYYLTNFSVSAEKFPMHIPEMTLKVNFILKQRKFVFYESNVTIAIEGKQSEKTTPLKGK